MPTHAPQPPAPTRTRRLPHRWLRVASGLLLALLLMPSATADPLARYRWKHRLIVFALPADDAPRQQLRQHQRRHREACHERDLLWIDLSQPPTQLPGTRQPDGVAALRRRLELAPGSYLLIGKDGQVKSRQTHPLDLAAWFDLIDQMPMRRREMRRQ